VSWWTVQISAGVGPLEVREFVRLLARELIEQCAAAGLEVRSVITHCDDEAPRSVEIDVAGPVLETLAGRLGTHVLLARSSRRGRRSRKRWFASVRAYEQEATAAMDAEIRPEDIEITAARAGGPGGQHVNTTSSAVRARHLPTRIAVRVASERSQQRNRSAALERLRGILGERREAVRTSEAKERRLAHYQLERGSAVCQWQLDERAGRLRQAR
jgi:peptide chain release factor 2/peptide chain release factor